MNISMSEISSIFGISYSNVKSYSRGEKSLSLADAARLLTVPNPQFSANQFLLACGIDDLDLEDIPVVQRISSEYVKVKNSLLTQSGEQSLYLLSNRKVIRFFDECGKNFYKPAQYVDVKLALSSYFDIYNEYQFDPKTNILSLFPDEVMALLMRSMMKIRRLKNDDITEIPQRSSKAQHIRRDHPISLFIEVCWYEKHFRSGGIYLFTEIINAAYRNKKQDDELLIL